MSMRSHVVVVVSDDSLLAHSIRAALRDRAALCVCGSTAEASKFLREVPRVVAILVDGALVPPQRLKELEALRRLSPLASMLYVAPRLSASLLNELQLVRVQVVVRPLPADALRLFLDRAFGTGRLERRALDAWIKRYAAERRLSRCDLELLPLVLEEESEAAACERLGIDHEQLRRSLRRLVKKCRVRNIDRLARNLIRDAYLFRSKLTAELIEPTGRAASF